MNVICAICKDHLVQSDDIFHTQCAHVFHLQCLTQWLERSNSCPQCRKEVTQNKIYRLYFTFSNNEPVEPQTCTTKEKIDSLNFKLLLKEKDMQYYTSKTVTLERQNAGLKQEVRKVESEIRRKNSTIYELREELKCCDELKKEIAQLKNKIENLKPIETLIHGPICNVNKMIGNTKNPEVLTKYISVMKKELLVSFGKRKQLRMTVRRLKDELASMEQSKQLKLQEKLAFTESECISLQKRVGELEEVLGINENCSSVSQLQQADIQSNVDENRPVEGNNQETSSETLTHTKRKKEEMSVYSTKNTEDKMPNFQLNNDSIDEENLNYNSSNDSSTISKRSRRSIDDTNASSKSDSSKLTKYTIPKKKRESNMRKKTSLIENRQETDIIDLT